MIPITDKELINIAWKINLFPDKKSFSLLRDVGPYEITTPTWEYRKLVEELIKLFKMKLTIQDT